MMGLLLALGILALYVTLILGLSRHARAQLRWVWRIPEETSGLRAFLLLSGAHLGFLVAVAAVIAGTVFVIWLCQAGL